MSSEYSLSLKATLDTSEVQQKLQQLGQTGAMVNNQIDQSVKNLDKSVKQLATSFDQAAKQQAQMGRLALRMGATYIGHQVLGNIASQNQGTNIGTLASVGQGAFSGAAIGAGAGLPGIVAGAAIGALTSALDELNKSAKAATDEIIRQAEAQQKQIRAWHTAKADVELQQQLKGVTAAQAGGLRAQASATRARYESFMTGEEGKKFAQEYKGDDFVNARDRYMKNLLKQLQVEEALAAQAEKLLDAENKEADAAKRKAEADEKAAQIAEERANAKKTAVAKSAAGALGSFQQQQRLQAFGESLQDLTPAELQNMKDNLVQQNSALAGKVTDLFSYAETTGSAADLEAAQNALSEFNEAARMLQMVEGVLGGVSASGGSSGLQALQQLSQLNTSGYSTLGNVSVGTAVQNLQMQEAKKTNDLLQSNNNTLQTMSTYVQEIKNKVSSSEGSSFYS